MKLPKNYFENLSVNKYKEYLKLLPALKKESTKAVTMLIFTFFALSFLGVFAINPTLFTIIDLHKQLEESQFVHEQLKTKMNNLSNLQQQYTNLSDELPFVYDAIPQQAIVPKLVGQIEAIGKKSNLDITSFTVSPLILSNPKEPNSVKSHYSFTFSLEAEGNYEDMLNFVTTLTNFDRIVTLESVSFVKNQQSNVLLLSVKGRQYYKK